MAEEGFKRKLTAILSADVEGYARLMGDDEEATVRTLTSYREVLTTLIQQHNGKVLDSPGDNLLAEFVSVVDAVQCAVAVQKEIKARNDELSESRRMQFRIGINLGDVIQEEERIYGDGVNIAARLEGLSEPGGICISKTAFDQIESKLPYGYEFLGDQSVKNISKPVGAYRVLMEPRVTVAAGPEKVKIKSVRRKQIIAGATALIVPAIVVGIWHFYMRRPAVERASVEKMAFPLPEKPSIAVLPFDNMSGDPEQEYFSDGMTDELISDLAKIENILVISRNSAFIYKGKKVKIKQIAKELNVRYVLEGSVQKSGNNVRIRAQLIDGQSDHHIWSESYDGVIDDIFELQDEITEKIVSALAIKLTPDEQLQRTQKQTNSIPAYHAFLRGMAYLRLYTPDDLIKAIQYFTEAVSLDPNYSEAYTALAKAYLIVALGGRDYWRKAGIRFRDGKIYARHFTELAMKKPVPQTYSILGRLEFLIRDWDKVTFYAEKAVALAPNDSEVLYDAGRALSWADKAQEAIKYLKRSNKLDPLNKAGAYMAHPYFSLKQYKEAVTAFEQGATNVRDEGGILPFAAASYAFLGRKEEAKATLDKWIQVVSRISADRIYSTYPMKNIEVFDRFMEGITLAGREGGTKIYLRVDENKKLTGQQIKELMFGRTELDGVSFIDEFFHRKEDGEVTYQSGDSVDSGESWIENDKLCNKFEKIFGGYKDCFYIYENPIGDRKYKNDYLKVADYGIVQFTLLK